MESLTKICPKLRQCEEIQCLDRKTRTGKCKSHWFYLWTLKIRNNFEGNKKLRTIYELPKILNSSNSSNTPPKPKRGKIVGKENTCTDLKSTFPPSGGHKKLL